MTAPKLTIDELSHFHGSEVLYRHPLMAGHSYTEGVRHLARRANCYWLLDAVFSHQIDRRIRAEPFQVWSLNVVENKAILTCTDGNKSSPIVLQNIEFTDFPLPTIELWLEDQVLMLPSER